jgi:hypothetical protein
LRGTLRQPDDLAASPLRRVARAALLPLRFPLASACLRRWPWLHAQVRRFVAHDAGMTNAADTEATLQVNLAPPPQPDTVSVELMPPGGDLSPRSLRVYRNLKRAYQNRKN